MNDDLPAVIFRLRGSELLGSSSGRKRTRVVLDADIYNEEIYDSALQKLQELKVYTVDDFKTELLKVLRNENRELERKLDLVVKHRDGLLEENKVMSAALSALHIGLR
jgi:hypothetical protein